MYFFTCHHCLNILIYTFKCTGKSSSICMTAGDDNDEGAFVKQPYVLHSIKFQNVCLCMSMYMLELSVELYILHEGTNIRVTAQSQFQPYYKLHSRFLHFRKFRLVISSTRGVMFTCLHGTLANSADPDQTPHNHGGIRSGFKLNEDTPFDIWVNIKCKNK